MLDVPGDPGAARLTADGFPQQVAYRFRQGRGRGGRGMRDDGTAEDVRSMSDDEVSPERGHALEGDSRREGNELEEGQAFREGHQFGHRHRQLQSPLFGEHRGLPRADG